MKYNFDILIAKKISYTAIIIKQILLLGFTTKI